MTPATNNINISMPSPEDAHLAMETSRKLAARFREDKDIEVK
mgnify:CR=1 FL=1